MRLCPFDVGYRQGAPASLFEEISQNREQCSSAPRMLAAKDGLPPLNPRNINFMQDFAKQTGMTAANCCQEKGLHFAENSPAAGAQAFYNSHKSRLLHSFQASVLLTPKLFAKVFTNERMRIEMSRIVRIFSQRGV